MLFQSKIDRAFKRHHDENGETEEEIKKQKDEGLELEKGDLLALMISAFGVIVPVVLVVLLVIAVIGYFFFFR